MSDSVQYFGQYDNECANAGDSDVKTYVNVTSKLIAARRLNLIPISVEGLHRHC